MILSPDTKKQVVIFFSVIRMKWLKLSYVCFTIHKGHVCCWKTLAASGVGWTWCSCDWHATWDRRHPVVNLTVDSYLRSALKMEDLSTEPCITCFFKVLLVWAYIFVSVWCVPVGYCKAFSCHLFLYKLNKLCTTYMCKALFHPNLFEKIVNIAETF